MLRQSARIRNTLHPGGLLRRKFVVYTEKKDCKTLDLAGFKKPQVLIVKGSFYDEGMR
jgi:hypothetical protein